ncbi:MAG: AAA family ATPase [Bacteroidales bacterium]|nr:AAA family ATPase [Bacteroidales bacterium]
MKLNNYEQKIQELNKKKNREEQNLQCEQYIEICNEVLVLETDIPVLQTEIETEQSEYLTNYFSTINILFQSLGSRDFTLSRNIEHRGNKDVYSLNISFKNQPINNNLLHAVFSESDRRALALSIFLAKIKLKPADEKLKTIIVLDDPATSFDDNRISNTINHLKSELSQISQLFIFTHYKELVKRFYEIINSTEYSIMLYQIRKNATTSFIDDIDKDSFVLPEHYKVFKEINDFILLNSDDINVRNKFRVFWEYHLKTIFAKQIADNNIDSSTPNNMINGLFDNNIISEEVKSELHRHRESFNPEHHIFTTTNIEDVRNYILVVFNYTEL